MKNREAKPKKRGQVDEIKSNCHSEYAASPRISHAVIRGGRNADATHKAAVNLLADTGIECSLLRPLSLYIQGRPRPLFVLFPRTLPKFQLLAAAVDVRHCSAPSNQLQASIVRPHFECGIHFLRRAVRCRDLLWEVSWASLGKHKK